MVTLDEDGAAGGGVGGRRGGQLTFESGDRLYQIRASPDHRLGSGRIGEVIWIGDASTNLFGLNGAIEVANATIEIGYYSFDLPNQPACGVDAKFSQPPLVFAKDEPVMLGHWPLHLGTLYRDAMYRQDEGAKVVPYFAIRAVPALPTGLASTWAIGHDRGSSD
jgi:hypothetical protein